MYVNRYTHAYTHIAVLIILNLINTTNGKQSFDFK